MIYGSTKKMMNEMFFFVGLLALALAAISANSAQEFELRPNLSSPTHPVEVQPTLNLR